MGTQRLIVRSPVRPGCRNGEAFVLHLAAPSGLGENGNAIEHSGYVDIN
jgi:hypothetical protein